VTVWWLAWRSALARRRLFVWNVAVPALLLTPVASSDAAAPHRVAVFGVFIVFFATFGAALPAVRDAREGWLDTVFRTGVRRPAWLVQTTLAEAAIDLVQLAPVTAVLALLADGASPASVPILIAALAVTLLFANVLGVVLAATVRSLAEAALASAAVSLLLLHFAGFFRPPVSGWTRALAALDPYSPLRVALARLEGLPGGGGLPPWAVVAALGLGGLAALTAGRWTRRFEWPATR